jgi:hypothetical protein
MPVLTTVIDVPASVAAGAWHPADGMRDKYVRLGGTFTATVQFEGSVEDDKSDPFSLGAAQTSKAMLSIPETVKWIRANTTAFASGAPTAKLVGNPT